MKIYTEVVYTWDDEKNELVKESEKSFDYEGELVQCIKIGGYSWKPPKVNITIPTVTIPDVMSTALDDGMGAITEGISTGIETLGEQTQLGGSTLDALQSGGGQITTGLNTTVGQAGNYLGDKIVNPITDGLNTGLSFMGYLGNKLSNFLYGSQNPSDVVVKNEKTAGGKDKQSAAELGVNKGQQRSRSSLKIS